MGNGNHRHHHDSRVHAHVHVHGDENVKKDQGDTTFTTVLIALVIFGLCFENR